MLVLVTGGSGSGKSAVAEDLLISMANESDVPMTKYYIATMKITDREDELRRERHLKMREGKEFITLEISSSLEHSIKQMIKEDEISPAAALVEGLSTLTANEMFADGQIKDEDTVVRMICRDIDFLAEHFTHTVLVTDNVFDDGMKYDETTVTYMRALGRAGIHAAKRADRVIEVAAGCPVVIKEQ